MKSASARVVDSNFSKSLPASPSNPKAAILTLKSGLTVVGQFMQNSMFPKNKVDFEEVVDCGIGDSKCPGPGGHLCLIER